jgi:hypothetical protein
MFNDIATEQQLVEQLLYPTSLPHAAGRPVYFARGNHDVRGAEARTLGRVLDTPAGHFHYSVRQGPVAFLVLDTGEDKADDHPVYAGLGTFDAYRSRQARGSRRSSARTTCGAPPSASSWRTSIRAEADGQVLKVRMHRLDGTLISDHVVPRRT